MRGTIENINFYVVRQGGATAAPPDVAITFWSSDDQNTTVLSGAPGTATRMLGFERLDENDWFREETGGTSALWRAYVGGIQIFYKDDDNTGEFHVTIENEQTTNIAAGKSRLEFGFRPDFGG